MCSQTFEPKHIQILVCLIVFIFLFFEKLTSHVSCLSHSQVHLVQSVNVPALVTGIWPMMGKTASPTMGNGVMRISSPVWTETVCSSNGSVMATGTVRMAQMSLKECVVNDLSN